MGYQVLFTDPIPVTVVAAEPPAPPGELPASATEVAAGPALLARVSVWRGPGPQSLAAALALPPVLCAGWYLAWRRRYPDAGRLARQRQSRAARRALTALHQAARQTGRTQAEGVSQAVVLYLRERFDLVPQEPTPEESARWLGHFGYSDAIMERLRQLLEACAADRFGPGPVEGGDRVGPARGLILDLEESPCPPSS
jgi:hypothetical protein